LQPNLLKRPIAALGVWLIAAGCSSPQTTFSSRDSVPAPPIAQSATSQTKTAKAAKSKLAVSRRTQQATSLPKLMPAPSPEFTRDATANRIQLAGALQSADVRQQIPELATERGTIQNLPDANGLGETEDLPAAPQDVDGNATRIPEQDAASRKLLDVVTGEDEESALDPAKKAVGNNLPQSDPGSAGPAEANESDANDRRDSDDAMHADGVDVHKLLEIMSREHNVNIMISPNVSGRVTVNLSGLNFDQRLEAVLKSCKLVAQHENGVIYVYTAQEMASRNGNDDPVGIRVYQLNYIRSTDLEKMLGKLLSSVGKMTISPASRAGIGQLMAPSTGNLQVGGGGGGGGSGGGGSGGGGNGGTAGSITGGDSLPIGEIVIVQDRESTLATLDEIIRKIDVQPQQVLIEAVILSTTLNKNLELGVNFGVVDSAGQVLSVFGSGAAINAATGFLPQSVLQAGTGLVTQGFATDDQGIKFGFVDKNVTGFIRALESVGNVEVLATPRLLVINKQPAELLLGQRLGYQVASQSLVSTVQNVQFLNVGTLLRVRPFISSDGMVRMEIHPERSTGRVINNIPQTDTSEVTTNVLVPDGATIVIGGLMDNEENQQHNGIPVLGRLPLLGPLFRDRIRTQAKKELIVLLTVQIWNPTPCPPPNSSAAKSRQLPAR
jgi:type IV pilus secretin PilQ/predicted competence protein